MSAQLGAGSIRLAYGALAAATTRNSYGLHSVRREAVDAVLAARGTSITRQTHSQVLASGQRISPHGDGLVRAQFSHWLFFDTIPVTHNSSTAARLANHDSVLTLGLRARF